MSLTNTSIIYRGAAWLAGFLLLCTATATSQTSPPLTAWLEQQSIDGKTVISSYCQNQSVSSLHLRYIAILTTRDTVLRQEGNTLAQPGQPTLLLKGVFAVPDGQFINATVEVYRQNERLATATLAGPAAATPNEEPLKDNAGAGGPLLNDDLEISGLVLDETRSKLAHDFYELFYSQWTAATEGKPASLLNLLVKEQPSSIGLGSRVIVEMDGEEITQLQLQPRAEVLENLASQLVEALQTRSENPEGNFKEIDGKDIEGTGIY